MKLDKKNFKYKIPFDIQVPSPFRLIKRIFCPTFGLNSKRKPHAYSEIVLKLFNFGGTKLQVS